LENKDIVKKGLVDKAWSFLASVKLAVIVFSVISLTSIIGTIIEQQAAPENNIRLLSKLFGLSGAHSVYSVLDAIGFTDMFNAWWFIALLFIFAANIVICSLERLPGIFRIVKEPVKPLAADSFDTVSSGREVVIKGTSEKAAGLIGEALRKIGFRSTLVKGEDGAQICAEKGRYSRLGVYITHFSILMILLGAVVGMKFGYNGSLKLLEGTSSGIAHGNNGRDIQLGFDIRCDDFEVTFYPESERPKEYKSILTIIENGREVLTEQIEVNSPLRYKGFTFYQSSYGFFPNKDGVFKFRLTAMEGTPQNIEVKFGQSFGIPGTKLSATVVDFSPALAVDREGKLFTFAESMINPAAFIEFSEAGRMKSRQWILKNYSETWKTPAGVLEFRDLWGVQYTGLQVRKDPGVWLVYLGCLIMAIGLYAAFFMSHRRIWIRLKEEKNSTILTIASSANKNRIAFEDRLDRFVEYLAKDRGQTDRGGH
jgi:cytochrome c biogenesis protein